LAIWCYFCPIHEEPIPSSFHLAQDAIFYCRGYRKHEILWTRSINIANSQPASSNHISIQSWLLENLDSREAPQSSFHQVIRPCTKEEFRFPWEASA
jgi:hypothetical protein